MVVHRVSLSQHTSCVQGSSGCMSNVTDVADTVKIVGLIIKLHDCWRTAGSVMGPDGWWHW